MHEKGSKDHPECPEGYVLLCGVFEIEEAYEFGYKDVRVGLSMYDVDGNLMPEQKPVFVSEEEYFQKNQK